MTPHDHGFITSNYFGRYQYLGICTRKIDLVGTMLPHAMEYFSVVFWSSASTLDLKTIKNGLWT